MNQCEYIYIWPDGSYAEDKQQLEEMLHYKSDDYRTVKLDETFDLEKQLLENDDASSDSQPPT